MGEGLRTACFGRDSRGVSLFGRDTFLSPLFEAFTRVRGFSSLFPRTRILVPTHVSTGVRVTLWLLGNDALETGKPERESSRLELVIS